MMCVVRLFVKISVRNRGIVVMFIRFSKNNKIGVFDMVLRLFICVMLFMVRV